MQGFCQVDPGKPPVSLAKYWDHMDRHVHDLYSELLESIFIRAIEPKFFASLHVITFSCIDKRASVLLGTIGMRKWFVPSLIISRGFSFVEQKSES